jgi:DNA ligase-1
MTITPYSLTNANRAPYALLAHAFSLIEGTTKRIEKTCFLTSLLHAIISRSRAGREGVDADAHTLLQTVYLCINRLSPDYEGIELGIGESLLIKAISESTGRKPQSVKDDLKKEGDLGLVAMVGPFLQKDFGGVDTKEVNTRTLKPVKRPYRWSK